MAALVNPAFFYILSGQFAVRDIDITNHSSFTFHYFLILLKIGLVGVGYLGSRHLRHLVSLDNVEVSGVWDADPAARRRMAGEFDVPAAGGLAELIDRSDAVDVATPTSTHCEIGLRVIAAGRPLFVEKPLCATYAEGLRLLEQSEAAGVQIQVGHIERFNRAFRALQGIQVRPRFIEAHRLAPWNPRGVDVAVVHDLMIHDLDLVLALSEGEPDHIHANGVGVVTDSIDIATARIEFTDGMVANLTASRISLKKMRRLRLFCGNEYIALDLGQGSCEYVGVTQDGQPVPDGAEAVQELALGPRRRQLYRRLLIAAEGDALRLELEAFRDAVLTGASPPVTGIDGLRVLKLAEQLVSIIQEG